MAALLGEPRSRGAGPISRRLANSKVNAAVSGRPARTSVSQCTPEYRRKNPTTRIALVPHAASPETEGRAPDGAGHSGTRYFPRPSM